MRTIAIVGATGAVGQEFASVMAGRRFLPDRWRLIASPRSAGRTLPWIGGPQPVVALERGVFDGVDIAFFSAGAAVSREWSPQAVRAGAIVIDNSSAFRMEPDVPLVVPEVNAHLARAHRGILSVANCSAIILAVPLWPLHREFRARRVVVATYQAVSGAGARAQRELEEQTRAALAGEPPRPEVFPVPCAFNVFSHNTPIGPDGYNVEESKIAAETRKIFGDESIRLTATCMRVPVMRAHTEAVNVEFERPVDPAAARELLSAAPGVRVVDDAASGRFPTPLEASGGDEVLVGRIRRDPTVDGERGLSFICSGDQLRKGAALNAVQIAELL
jgi:aspartate-semialdehyde dehydrogenase